MSNAARLEISVPRICLRRDEYVEIAAEGHDRLHVILGRAGNVLRVEHVATGDILLERQPDYCVHTATGLCFRCKPAKSIGPEPEDEDDWDDWDEAAARAWSKFAQPLWSRSFEGADVVRIARSGWSAAIEWAKERKKEEQAGTVLGAKSPACGTCHGRRLVPCPKCAGARTDQQKEEVDAVRKDVEENGTAFSRMSPEERARFVRQAAREKSSSAWRAFAGETRDQVADDKLSLNEMLKQIFEAGFRAATDLDIPQESPEEQA